MIYAEARRASRIVQNLLTFARQHKPERTPTSVNQVLDDTLELRGYELRVRGIDVQRDYDEQSPETMADAHQLQQVFPEPDHERRAGDGARGAGPAAAWPFARAAPAI